MVLTVRCTPNLGVFPRKVEIWVDKVTVITPLYLCYKLILFLVAQHQTKNATFVLGGYLMEMVEKKTGGYKCEMSISVDVTRYTSIVGKNFPLCKMFIPTFGGSFVNPCKGYLGNHFKDDSLSISNILYRP